MTDQQRAELTRLLERHTDERPDITIHFVMRFLKTKNIDVRIESDVDQGAITLRF